MKRCEIVSAVRQNDRRRDRNFAMLMASVWLLLGTLVYLVRHA